MMKRTLLGIVCSLVLFSTAAFSADTATDTMKKPASANVDANGNPVHPADDAAPGTQKRVSKAAAGKHQSTHHPRHHHRHHHKHHHGHKHHHKHPHQHPHKHYNSHPTHQRSLGRVQERDAWCAQNGRRCARQDHVVNDDMHERH